MNNQNNKTKDTLHILMDATVEALLETVEGNKMKVILKKIADIFEDKCKKEMLIMKAEINKMKGVKTS